MSKAKLSDRQIRQLVEAILGDDPYDDQAKALCILIKTIKDTKSDSDRDHIWFTATERAFQRTGSYARFWEAFANSGVTDLGL